MKLEEIHSEILNEAVSGPLAAFEYALRAAGKGISEANSALLSAVQKINPSVRQLYRATDEEISKALLRVEFKEYRQIIAKSIIANKEREIELILKSSDLTTTQGIKQAKADIANRLGVKNAFANEIVNLKLPKTRPIVNPRGPSNPFDTLRPVTIPQETKNAFIEMMNKKGIKIKSQDLDNVMIELQKSVDQQLAKAEKTFKDPTFIKTLQAYNRLPLSEQEQIINKVIESVKNSYGEYLLGLKVTTKTKEKLQSAWNKSVDAFFLGQKEKGKMLDWASFFSWWKNSIGVSFGLFTYSIYVEAVRNEGKGLLNGIGFAFEKIIQAPDRLMKSLIPGVNLIYSSAAAITQTFLFSVEYIAKKLNLEPDKKPTLKQRIKTGKKYVDSTYKANKPKLDSLNQEYKPKVDSTLQSLKNKLNPQPSVLDKTGKQELPKDIF
jgi:hypothetical protein